MNKLNKGDYVYSLSGRDIGNIYIVLKTDDENVYLVDGKGKTIAKPKKKNLKHVKSLDQKCYVLAEKLENNKQVLDAEVKKWIRLMTSENK